ncbi:MAG: hypothetical protein WA304_02870 [Candidatus Cybelea sp.]
MQYEVACNRIRSAITTLLLELRPPTSAAAYAAACATQSVAAALHHACGRPDDPRWTAALTSLQAFLEYCDASPKMSDSVALLELRGFIAENADLSAPGRAHALAS